MAFVLGSFALLSVLWFPTLALALGIGAVVVGALGRRRGEAEVGHAASVWPQRLIALSIAMGTAAVVATVVVVIATTG